MKKIILLTFIGSLFAAGSALANCPACPDAAQKTAMTQEAKGTCPAGGCCAAKAATASASTCTKDKAVETASQDKAKENTAEATVSDEKAAPVAEKSGKPA